MGGLITRYTLTYMEENNMQHQTKLFISFDSPQKGGYAPLSLQALLSDPVVRLAGLTSPKLAYLVSCFISHGSLQMLTHHPSFIADGYANPTNYHTEFFNELNNMNTCGGYPFDCKSVAISNGSLNAETQEGLNGWGDYSGNPAVYFYMLSGVIQRLLSTVPGIDNWALTHGTCIYRGIEDCDSEQTYYIKHDGLPLDHAPGGYYPWYETLFEQLENISGIEIIVHNSNDACFVPAISSLGLNTNHLLLNIGSYTKDQILQDTYFDDIWWNTTHSNMKHASYYDSSLGSNYYAIYNFIEDQIYTSVNENYARINNSISSGSTISGDKKLYKASNLVSIENHTVNNGGQLTLKSGNAITLNPGFIAESGSSFSALIENIHTRNCSLAGNLPQFTPASLKSAKTHANSYKIDTVLRGCNISMYAPFDVNSYSSMKEQTLVFDILQKKSFHRVFPNPTKNVINIIYTNSDKQNIIIKLIEPITGKTLKTIFSDDKISEIYMNDIDVSYLSNGCYVIQIQTEIEMICEKFIKL